MGASGDSPPIPGHSHFIGVSSLAPRLQLVSPPAKTLPYYCAASDNDGVAWAVDVVFWEVDVLKN